ncbi:MAG: HIT domain-containing protein [Deltaproteobacteria bacterium]|nr:HIT domain-containing protein [Deltaproteobacteria bacterium]
MEKLWAPWRMEFILNEKPAGCIFCLDERKDKASEKDRLVLLRDRHTFVMMNRYPYSCGHLLVSPNRHVADMGDLLKEEMLELFENVRLCCRVMTRVMSPQGFNVGINVGKAAGAGVDDHLHIHVVPRWVGDSNFMTVIADTRVMPENLAATYDKLYPSFLEAAGASTG